MSRNTKLILGVLGTIVLLGVCACVLMLFALREAGEVVSESVKIDPTEAVALAADIADFELPPGYELGAMDFFGFYKAVIASSESSDKPVIALVQMPSEAEIEQEEFKQAVERQLAREGYEQLTWEPVDEITSQIRGEEVNFIVYQGSDESGGSFRRIYSGFPGKDGLVFLMIMGPTDGWDQAEVEAFIRSIR
jgi:hypothetical protein